ncbi:ribbon-helix-helix domain-containing protein [Marinomonas pollencensis]|uniref:Putative DNA-binding ribbon-helix-helix protein n=1 Tax=Marinomonas pollencensis TaxID=491954 RepID=A0A3E0DNP3_9GAMM|nr:ribbon-helix-helix domain-containing protein [Marinomonas pollencensis]REG83769.1 putative DNA-binding ribbon-helix-helix protein [Marinomonas pollencensis]
MCKLFINADTELWSSTTHSLRINGMVTSVRLENAYWALLTEIGARDGLSVTQLITRLYQESIKVGHDVANFTSFLRVCALRYQALQLNGDIPLQTDVPIASLDSERILQNESKSASRGVH